MSILSVMLAIFIISIPVLYDNDHPSIAYSDGWSTQTAPGALGGYTSYSFTSGATACLAFLGSQVDFVTYTRSKRGHSYVYMDGQQIDYVDHYSPSLVWRVAHTYPVGYGQHTICVVAQGDSRIDVDGFYVLDDGGAQPTPVPTSTPTPQPPSGHVILCIGDSTTANPLVEPQDNYPAILQVKLDQWHGPGNYTVLNYGQRGWFTDQILAELSGWLSQTNPDYLLVLAGINDMRHDQPPEQVRAEIQQIIDTARSFSPGMKIIVSSVTSNVADQECDTVCMADLGSEMTGYLEGYDVLTHSNFFALLSNPYHLWEQADQRYFADQLHPNAAGNQILAMNFYWALASLW